MPEFKTYGLPKLRNSEKRWRLWLFSMQEHKNCGEMTEIEAKVKYVKLARSLQTYGVSFFLVKVRVYSSTFQIELAT